MARCGGDLAPGGRSSLCGSDRTPSRVQARQAQAGYQRTGLPSGAIECAQLAVATVLEPDARDIMQARNQPGLLEAIR